MKNKFIILLLFVFFSKNVLANNLNIQSKEIFVDKKTKVTIFKNEVVAVDQSNNIFKGDYAEYNKTLKTLKSKGPTTIETSEGYKIEGNNIVFDNKNNLISSKDPAIVKDLENNNIFLDQFEYSTINKFFKSYGNIKVIDARSNTYNFSQIFIDEKKREILGTDNKSYLNDSAFKISEENKPRIFSNTVNIKSDETKFTKCYGYTIR